MSVATCYLTWRLHEVAQKEELTHFAITDPDCPRIPDTDGITVPSIVPGEELSQIFLDLRMTDILSWNVINILHDDTFGDKATSSNDNVTILLSNANTCSRLVSDRDTISRVLKAISNKLPNKRMNLISRSIFSLRHGNTGSGRKSSVKKMLNDFHVEQLGHCFLVIATVDMVADVMQTL